MNHISHDIITSFNAQTHTHTHTHTTVIRKTYQVIRGCRDCLTTLSIWFWLSWSCYFSCWLQTEIICSCWFSASGHLLYVITYLRNPMQNKISANVYLYETSSSLSCCIHLDWHWQTTITLIVSIRWTNKTSYNTFGYLNTTNMLECFSVQSVIVLWHKAAALIEHCLWRLQMVVRMEKSLSMFIPLSKDKEEMCRKHNVMVGRGSTAKQQQQTILTFYMNTMQTISYKTVSGCSQKTKHLST